MVGWIDIWISSQKQRTTKSYKDDNANNNDYHVEVALFDVMVAIKL